MRKEYSHDFDEEKRVVIKDNFLVENFLHLIEAFKNNFVKTILILLVCLLLLLAGIVVFTSREEFKITEVNSGEIEIDREIVFPLFPGKSYNVFSPCWSPDGKKIIFVSDIDGSKGLWLINSDGRGKPEKISKTITRNNWLTKEMSIEEHTNPSWSPRGDRISFVMRKDKNLDIWLMNEAGKLLKKVTIAKGSQSAPDWSPDGTKLVYQSHEKEAMNLWIIRSDGLEKWKITDNEFINAAPSWSPDGDYIVFTSNRSHRFQIWILELRRESLPVQLTSGDRENGSPVWSPDGKKILYISKGKNSRDLWVMDKTGENNSRLTFTEDIDEYEPAWSPDGKEIIFCCRKKNDNRSDLKLAILRRKN